MFIGTVRSVSKLLFFVTCGFILGLITTVCDANNGPEEIHGDLYIELGQTLTVHQEGMDVYGSIFNNGTVLIVPFKTFWAEHQFENSGLIEMLNGDCTSHEVFKNLDNGEIKGCGIVSSSEDIHNRGLIHSLGGPLWVYSDVGFSNTGTLANNPGTTVTIVADVPLIDNQGTIEVASDGAVVFDCNLANEPNGVVKLLGGTLAVKTINQKTGATLEGFGGVTGNVVIEPNAIIKFIGPTNIVGNVEIGENATLEISDGTTLITGQVTCKGTIHIKGGQFIPQGDLSGNCNIIWEPGIYSNVVDFNLDGQVNIKDFAFFADTWLWQTAWR